MAKSESGKINEEKKEEKKRKKSRSTLREGGN